MKQQPVNRIKRVKGSDEQFLLMFMILMVLVLLAFITITTTGCTGTRSPSKGQPPAETQPPVKYPPEPKKPTPPPPPPVKAIEVPETEEFSFGVDGGVEGGVEGGKVGGVLGAPAPSYNQPPQPRAKKMQRVPGLMSPPQDFNTEEYAPVTANRFLKALDNPLSTFSIDVDTGSYSNVRRFLTRRRQPPKGAVRIEEMINYFRYDYPQPKKKHPFSITTELSRCPWNDDHHLLHIGILGREMKRSKTPPSNLVFLLDVSGSMSSQNKLPLVQASMRLLVEHLDARSRVAIVVYAGAAGLVLPSTPGDRKNEILAAIDNLRAGGCTAGGAGIRLAYKVAEENFIEKGNNRIILATDGDFNIGISSTSAMVELVEKKRESGVFLTTMGFGMGNYKDNRLEQLADKGNGSYHYIDTIKESKKVFAREMLSTMFTIAKDVKIQVEFNPAKVASYRLIGYENRALRKEDFADDKKDAGELGAGHTVTALYEIVPAGVKQKSDTSTLRFQETKVKAKAFKTRELALVKLRYKKPDGHKSRLITRPVVRKKSQLHRGSANARFSAAVALFGMLLRNSQDVGDATLDTVTSLAESAVGDDTHGYRSEFLQLVAISRTMRKN